MTIADNLISDQDSNAINTTGAGGNGSIVSAGMSITTTRSSTTGRDGIRQHRRVRDRGLFDDTERRQRRASGGDNLCGAGIYNESVTISEPLTLLGAQFGVDARTGRTDPAAESIIDGAAGPIIYNSGGDHYTWIDNVISDNVSGMQGRGPHRSAGARGAF